MRSLARAGAKRPRDEFGRVRSELGERRMNRIKLVKLFSHTKWGKISSEKLNFGHRNR